MAGRAGGGQLLSNVINRRFMVVDLPDALVLASAWHGVGLPVADGTSIRSTESTPSGPVVTASKCLVDRVLASERRAGSKFGGAFPGGKKPCRRSVVVFDRLSPPGTDTSTETEPAGRGRRSSHLARAGVPAHDLTHPHQPIRSRDAMRPRRTTNEWPSLAASATVISLE